MMNERISALMDGELDADESAAILRDLRQDEALREAWARFHLIGDAMRGSGVLRPDFAARVSARLMLEPTVMVLVPRPPRPAAKRYALPLAASVAALSFVGILAWQLAQLNRAGEGTPQIASVSTSGPVATPVSTRSVSAASHAYLLAHQEFSPSYAMEGTTAYIRTVSAQR